MPPDPSIGRHCADGVRQPPPPPINDPPLVNHGYGPADIVIRKHDACSAERTASSQELQANADSPLCSRELKRQSLIIIAASE